MTRRRSAHAGLGGGWAAGGSSLLLLLVSQWCSVGGAGKSCRAAAPSPPHVFAAMLAAVCSTPCRDHLSYCCYPIKPTMNQDFTLPMDTKYRTHIKCNIGYELQWLHHIIIILHRVVLQKEYLQHYILMMIFLLQMVLNQNFSVDTVKNWHYNGYCYENMRACAAIMVSKKENNTLFIFFNI